MCPLGENRPEINPNPSPRENGADDQDMAPQQVLVAPEIPALEEVDAQPAQQPDAPVAAIFPQQPVVATPAQGAPAYLAGRGRGRALPALVAAPNPQPPPPGAPFVGAPQHCN